MEGIIPLLIIGVFFYLLLFRRGGMGGMGGMGCCGGHGSHDIHPDHNASSDMPHKERQDVIDLREGDYTVLPPGKGKVSQG